MAIVTGHGYDLTMEDLTALPIQLASGVVSDPSPEAKPRMEAFLKARLETVLHEQGIPVEVVRAVLSGNETRLPGPKVWRKRSQILSGPLNWLDLCDRAGAGVGVLGKSGASREVQEALLKEDAKPVSTRR